MYNTFIKAFAWNSSALFIYKITLLAHQILLYSIVSESLYGLQSMIFAVIYTMIALTNFGFDETLLPFFAIFSKNKHNFLQLLWLYAAHAIIVSIITLTLSIVIFNGSVEYLHNVLGYCNKNLILYLIALFYIESAKRSLIAIMQLAFLNKSIAYAQISMLTAYIVSVWSLFAWHKQLTLECIFIPMLITSGAELLYLAYTLALFYQGLPLSKQDQAGTPIIPFKVLFNQRLNNYINQIVKVIYSPNMMTLFFSYTLGFQRAAVIKFFTNIITLCYTCIAKAVGVTSGATFASMNTLSRIETNKLFTYITYRYFQFLSILSFIMLSIVAYAYYSHAITQHIALQIILFFTISFLEHVLITYEQLIMSQGKTSYLTCINISCLILLCIFGYLYHHNAINSLIFFTIFIIIKLINFLLLYFSICSKRNL